MNLLCIECLDYEVDDDELRLIFSPFGTITSARVMRDAHSNQSMGFGFVSFSSHDEADCAISVMDQALVRGKQLDVALAQPQAQRGAQTEQLNVALAQPQACMTAGPGRGGGHAGPSGPSLSLSVPTTVDTDERCGGCPARVHNPARSPLNSPPPRLNQILH